MKLIINRNNNIRENMNSVSSQEVFKSRELQINNAIIEKLLSSWDTDKLFDKYQKIYPILGPGVWYLSFTMNTENIAYQQLIDLGHEAVSYMPIKAITYDKNFDQFNIISNFSRMNIIIDIHYTYIEKLERKFIPVSEGIHNVCCEVNANIKRYIYVRKVEVSGE